MRKRYIPHYLNPIHSILGIAFLLLCSTRATSQDPLIFPIPQEMEVGDDRFVFDQDAAIVVPPNASDRDLSLARMLVRDLSDRYGIAMTIQSNATIPAGKKVVLLGTIHNPLVKKFCADNNIALTAKNPGAEGYILNVQPRSIVVGGSDDAGAFYGLQSLRQLLSHGNGKEVKSVRVRDWPNLPFRAIRLYVPGPENMAFFNRFLEDFMALYKFNKVVLELNCMRLDKHPEVNTGWIEFAKYMQYTRSNSTEGIYGEEKNSSHYDAGDGFILEKDDVRALVAKANKNFIEVIPEIPSLTHGYYLLTKHPELAEYPGDRWPDTYCPSNPKSYELMFDVYDEYMEVIKPKMVHIGHDEWWGAPVDVCPLCKGKDYSKLFAGDVNKIHGYFKEKGIKIAMWGDYLLESVRDTAYQERTSSTGRKYRTPGAVRPEIVRESIPKDILVFNWFWIDQLKEKELDDMGFTQIYGNFTPNISDWDNRIKKIRLAGGAPSSWAATNEFNFGKDLILDYLGCANLVWSKHTIRPEELPAIVWKLVPSVRSRMQAKLIPSRDQNKIESVDISSYANLPASTAIFDVNLKTLGKGAVNNGPAVFKMSASAKENSVIAVGAQGTGMNFPVKKVEGIKINEDVSSLMFLHACARQAGNQKAYFDIPDMFDSSDLLGYYEIVYEDGYKITIPLQYGVNIMEWNIGGEKSLDKREGETGAPQLAYCYEADPIDCTTSKENPIFFYSYEWMNPRFGKVIREVNLIGSTNFQALQQDYGTPVTKPMEANAVFLAAISKVKKQESFKPKK